jgi:hypothetical protein
MPPGTPTATWSAAADISLLPALPGAGSQSNASPVHPMGCEALFRHVANGSDAAWGSSVPEEDSGNPEFSRRLFQRQVDHQQIPFPAVEVF